MRRALLFSFKYFDDIPSSVTHDSWWRGNVLIHFKNSALNSSFARTGIKKQKLSKNIRNLS